MRLFINEYTKVFAYSLLGLIFALSSFYLIANIYHYKAVRYQYDINLNDNDDYKKLIKNINEINYNLNIDLSNYNGKIDNLELIKLKSSLSGCLESLDGEYLKSIKNKKQINIKDVENLRKVTNNEIVNYCLIENVYDLTSVNSEIIGESSEILKNNIDSLSSRLDYINRDIMDNSSLFFDSKNSIYNKTEDNFNNLLSICRESSDIILMISSKLNEEVSANG